MSLIEALASQLGVSIKCEDQVEFVVEKGVNTLYYYWNETLICVINTKDEDYEFTELGVKLVGFQLTNEIGRRIKEYPVDFGV